MTTSQIIKGSKMSKFLFFRDNEFIYQTDNGFRFVIPLEDAKGATFNAEDRNA